MPLNIISYKKAIWKGIEGHLKGIVQKLEDSRNIISKVDQQKYPATRLKRWHRSLSVLTQPEAFAQIIWSGVHLDFRDGRTRMDRLGVEAGPMPQIS